MKTLLDQIRDEYDFIIIDCPPSLHKLTVSALNAATSVIITMLPEASSMKGLSSLLGRISEIKKHINREMKVDGILFTMVKKNSVHDAFKNALLDEINDIHIFKTEIKHLVDIQKAQALQQPIGVYNKKSEGFKAYEEFANEYLEII